MTASNSEATESLCPICLTRIPAERVIQGETVFLEKSCPEHGFFRVPIWRGSPAWKEWQRPRIPTRPEVCAHEVAKGCPFDCGLCPDHRQHTCAALLEVTRRCNLYCPVCYADTRPAPNPDTDPDPSLGEIREWYQSVRETAGNCNIQLSGGEPTVREDLPEMVALGGEAGFRFIQLNTNGLRLAREAGYAAKLKQAGLASVFLQFDGIDDAVYRRIRGKPLLAEKLAAIEACAESGIGTVLVPTLVKGINTDQVGKILELAMQKAPAVRGVHFQPLSYFGRYPTPPADDERLTLPEVMRLIEAQTDGRIRAGHFRPPGCEHFRCSFHANYLLGLDGGLKLLGPEGDCCQGPEKAEEGARRSIAFVAKQWSAPPPTESTAGQKPCCACSGENSTQIMSLDDFLATARTHTFAVSAMAFQDAWNVDLERVRECCIHIVSPKGDLIPFCACNITSQDGKSLYR